MNFVKLELTKNKTYFYKKASNIEMGILGFFLTDDVSCSDCSISSYRKWIFDDLQGESAGGNCTFSEKDGNYIYLSDLFPEGEDNLIKLKISRNQLAQILDDWKEKVCKKKPMEVVIKYESNIFTIETKE